MFVRGVVWNTSQWRRRARPARASHEMERAVRLLQLIFLATLLFIPTACRSPSPVPRGPSRVVRRGQTSRARRSQAVPIVASVGQTFAIEVPSNRATGYMWTLAKAPASDVIAFMCATFRGLYQCPSGTTVGAGGFEVYTFQAVGKGKTRLELECRRPWQEDVAPAQRLVYAVTVK